MITPELLVLDRDFSAPPGGPVDPEQPHPKTILLNRERAINALTPEMFEGLHDLLTAWRDDPTVSKVSLAGAGDRGFCAGADVRRLAEMVRGGGDWLDVLRLEYRVDSLIANYPKPITAHMDGITMGGGLGLASAASERLVRSGTRVAMPETKIGFFPDAGVMVHLARGGSLGRHMALTSATVGPGRAMNLGLADDSADCVLGGPPEEDLDWIEECYASEDVIEIARRLAEHPHPEARSAGEDLRARSPFAVHVTMEALRRAENLDRDGLLAQDLRLAERMIPVDFVEGVRALLVDKDNSPRWRWERLEDVPQSEIDDVFA